MSKYSVGIYSTEPASWKPDNSAGLRRTVAALPTVAVTTAAEGPATIETYSVRYDWPTRTGIIIGRLDADNSWFLAATEDEALVALLSDGEPVGARSRCTPRRTRTAPRCADSPQNNLVESGVSTKPWLPIRQATAP
jgi:acetyl-CoA C-acetyltransferase